MNYQFYITNFRDRKKICKIDTIFPCSKELQLNFHIKLQRNFYIV